MSAVCTECGSIIPKRKCPFCGSDQPRGGAGRLKTAGAMLLLGLTMAADGPVEAPVPLYGIEPVVRPVIEPVLPPEPVVVESAAELLETAGERIRAGDLDGASILLNQALERDPASEVEVRYQRANILALRRDYRAARQAYAALVSDRPASHRYNDARFRVAELTGVLGDPAAAVQAFDELANLPSLSETDQAKIDLNRAIFNMDVDQPRKARKGLVKALTRVEPGLVSYYEAKAWAWLSDDRLDQADAIDLDVRERKLKRRLGKRTTLMREADAILNQSVKLNEPEWVFAGLIRMAASFEELGDDLLTAREPKLTEAQLKIYRTGVAERAEAFWVQGLKYLEGGIDVADRVAWTSARVQTLKDERDRLQAKIEAGIPAD